MTVIVCRQDGTMFNAAEQLRTIGEARCPRCTGVVLRTRTDQTQTQCPRCFTFFDAHPGFTNKGQVVCPKCGFLIYSQGFDFRPGQSPEKRDRRLTDLLVQDTLRERDWKEELVALLHRKR